MPTYIALLKGINVGGHKKVPMVELRELLLKTGFQNVQTYIQSGNVVLKSSDETDTVEQKIYKAIQTHFGFDVAVIVKTRDELQSIFDTSPFSNDKKENSYFITLNKPPKKELLKDVESISYENEEVVIKKDAFYFYSSKGYGSAKFNMNTYEKKLKVIGTVRNYNTMVKLIAMSSESEKEH